MSRTSSANGAATTRSISASISGSNSRTTSATAAARQPLLAGEPDVEHGIITGGGGAPQPKSDDDDLFENAQAILEQAPDEFAVNMLFVRRAWRLLKIGFGQCCGATGRIWLTVFLNVLAAATQALWLNPMLGKLLDSIVRLDKDYFMSLVYQGSAAVIILVSITCICAYNGELLALGWRRRITRHLQKEYFLPRMVYNLNNLDRRIDNTDQRMSTSVLNFTYQFTATIFGNYLTPLSILLMLVQLLLSLASIASQGWIPPVVCIVYSSFAYLLLRPQIKAVAGLTFQQNKYEGNFRFIHTRIRTFCESIAFYGGEIKEAANSEAAFQEVYSNYRALTLRSTWVQFTGFLTGGYLNINGTSWNVPLGFLVVYFIASSGQHEFSGIEDITTVALAVQSSVSALISIPILMAQFSKTAGECHRIGQMMEVIDDLKERRRARDDRGQTQNGETIKLENATVRTPDGKRVLFNQLNFEVKQNQSLLITGASGVGKSSLLRVIGGLWPIESGGLLTKPEKVGNNGIFFVPQRPYTTKGTLREQLVYPDVVTAELRATKGHEERMDKILKQVGLSYLKQRWGLDVEADWSELLSGGEQQRLGFARLFYHRPRYAIMDESTSALDVELEHKCMSECKAMNIAMISVAHRPSLFAYHTMNLNIEHNGGWKLRPISDEEQKAAVMIIPGDGNDNKDNSEQSAQHVDVASDNQVSARYGCEFYQRLLRLMSYGLKKRYIMLTMILNMGIAAGGVFVIDRMSLAFQYLDDKSHSDAAYAIIASLVVVLIMAILNAICLWIGQVAGLNWRRTLQRHFHHLYFQPMIPYRVNNIERDCDNMDNRITTDVKLLTETLITLIFENLIPVFVGSFVLAYISIKADWLSSVAIMGWCVFSIFVGQLLLSCVSRTTFILQMKEGAFRYLHGRIRTFCESIAFYNGEDKEKSDTDQSFTEIYDMTIVNIRSQVPLRMFTYFAMFFGGLISYIIVGLHTIDDPSILDRMGSGSTKFRVKNLVSQISGLGNCMQLFPAFLGLLGLLAGLTHRVQGAMDTLERVVAHKRELDAMGTRLHDNAMRLHHVTVKTPRDGKILFRDMTLNIEPAKGGEPPQSLIIMGPSGSGKSSILRVLGGLWEVEQGGTVTRPNMIGQGGCFFLPQSPYITRGTLRDQIIYPHSPHEQLHDDDTIRAILKQVELERLYEDYDGSLDEIIDWPDMLSIGQQQRIGFARLFYHRPAFVLMDESTSALDIALEAKCLARCKEMGVVMISVAHRPTVIKFHEQMLRVTPKGEYAVSAIVRGDPVLPLPPLSLHDINLSQSPSSVEHQLSMGVPPSMTQSPSSGVSSMELRLQMNQIAQSSVVAATAYGHATATAAATYGSTGTRVN